jgi:hypothetical protein
MGSRLASTFLSFLVLALCVIIGVAVVGAYRNPQNRVQDLSAIASSISAMVAAVVALWVAWREYQNRERARMEAEEKRKEAEEKEYTARKRIAALLAGNLIAWYERKDVQELLRDFASTKSKDSVESDLKLGVMASKSPKRAGEPDSTFWKPEITRVAAAIRLDAFERFTAIPNIWNVQSRSEREGGLRGIDSDFFATMDTIWTNLEISVQQLKGSFAKLMQIRKDESDSLEILSLAVVDEAAQLKDNIKEFIEVAKTAGKTLLAYNEEGSVVLLRAPASLLEKSRKRPPSVSQALTLLSYLQSSPEILSSWKQARETQQQFLDDAKSVVDYFEKAQHSAEDIASKLSKPEEPPQTSKPQVPAQPPKADEPPASF